MKKVLLLLVTALLMTSCVTLTPEQKAALEKYTKGYVRQSVMKQKYDINVTSMTPMRAATSYSVAGHWLKVDSIYLDCSLPYAGFDDIPHLKTRSEARMDSRLEFKSEILEYVVNFQPKEQRAIATFTTDYHGDLYTFTITIEDDGDTHIHLEPDKRDYIDYDGNIVVPKPEKLPQMESTETTEEKSEN